MKVTYKAFTLDGGFLPDFIIFNPEERQFEIYTANEEDTGTHHFKVKAYVKNIMVLDTQEFSLIIFDSVNNEPVWEENIAD